MWNTGSMDIPKGGLLPHTHGWSIKGHPWMWGAEWR
jgi:hypothetical protein